MRQCKERSTQKNRVFLAIVKEPVEDELSKEKLLCNRIKDKKEKEIKSPLYSLQCRNLLHRGKTCHNEQ